MIKTIMKNDNCWLVKQSRKNKMKLVVVVSNQMNFIEVQAFETQQSHFTKITQRPAPAHIKPKLFVKIASAGREFVSTHQLLITRYLDAIISTIVTSHLNKNRSAESPGLEIISSLKLDITVFNLQMFAVLLEKYTMKLTEG